jgi:tetratricopeptide (TPR) repeat protein
LIPWSQSPYHNNGMSDAGPGSGSELPTVRYWTRRGLSSLKRTDRRKLIVRGIIVFSLIGIVISQLYPTAPPENKDRTPAAQGKTSVSFDKLTNEQRSVVKDSFSLARNLYVQGKYELCLTELAKLHELIPQHENSKELQSFCEQGRELVHRENDRERVLRERAAIEQQISNIAENCKVKLKENGSVDETRQCLAEAMELDPEHHLIVEMIHTAQMHEEERKFISAQKAVMDAKVKKGQAHFKRADDLYKKGELKKAMTEYDKFINTPYPRSEDNKNTAKRNVASIQEQIKNKVKTYLDQCRSLGGKNQYRDAILACDKALVEEPGNSGAEEIRARMLSQLKQELKGVYEESVIEESLGNFDGAKDKWKKIVKDDLPTGEYAKKARAKLQKYGVGT